MVYPSPYLQQKILKLKAELFILDMKKKLIGSLSEQDEKRYKEIMRQLSIKY